MKREQGRAGDPSGHRRDDSETTIPRTRAEFVTAEAQARILGLERKSLYALVSKGLPAYRLGRRALRFDPDEVAEWLRSRRTSEEARP